MSRMRIAVLDDYQGVAESLADWASLAPEGQVEFFHDHVADEVELARRLRPFAVVMVMRERTPFPRSLLEALPNLRLLVTSGRRNTALDIEAAKALGVQVCGTETLTHPTMELTWALILALTRQIPREVEALKSGRWQTSIGGDLVGRTLGILGLGRLGSQVAAIGKAFGMNVIAWSQNLTAEAAADAGAVRVEKAELFAQADVLTIHLVLSPRSQGLVGAAELALMKPTALLINTSRSGIVDQAALLETLTARRIGGAGLDVFDQEPLPEGYPLPQLDNVVATPHLGYVTADNYRRMYGQAVEAIAAYMAGQSIPRAL